MKVDLQSTLIAMSPDKMMIDVHSQLIIITDLKLSRIILKMRDAIC